MLLRILCISVAGLLAGAAVAGAQSVRASIDAGTSSVRYADSIAMTALSLSPAFQLTHARGSLGGSGTLSQASGASSYSGNVFAAVGSSAQRRLSAEVGASAGGSAHSDGSRTGQMLGTGRLYVNAAPGGVWGGAGIGRTHDGSRWRGVFQGSAGGWISGAPGSAVLAISPTAVDDTIRYTDAVATLQRAVGSLELMGSLGMRLGDPLPTLVTERAWGSISATAWLRPRVALVAGAGTYPIDFTQGFPGGRFLMLGLRFATSRSLPSATPQDSDPAATEARAFEVRPAGTASRLRVHAPGARSVDVSGDFTNWTPVALTADGNGWWTLTRVISRGTHEINVRVDGGAWRVPPGLTSLSDEFGGSSGLLVIP